jgi:putative transposase
LLPSARIARLKEICAEIGKRYCFEFDTIGTDGDHVHISIVSEPKYSPSKVMQIIKVLQLNRCSNLSPRLGKSFGVASFGATVDISVRLVRV